MDIYIDRFHRIYCYILYVAEKPKLSRKQPLLDAPIVDFHPAENVMEWPFPCAWSGSRSNGLPPLLLMAGASQGREFLSRSRRSRGAPNPCAVLNWAGQNSEHPTFFFFFVRRWRRMIARNSTYISTALQQSSSSSRRSEKCSAMDEFLPINQAIWKYHKSG